MTTTNEKPYQVWTYDVNRGKSLYARLFLTSDGGFCCLSDYGNWAHWWSSKQDDMRGFFVRLSRDYVLLAISAAWHLNEVYFPDKTRKAVENFVDLSTRGMAEEDRGRERDLIGDVDWESSHAYWDWRARTKIDVEEPQSLAQHGYHPWALQFVDKLLPLLQAEVRAELERESSARAAKIDGALTLERAIALVGGTYGVWCVQESGFCGATRRRRGSFAEMVAELPRWQSGKASGLGPDHGFTYEIRSAHDDP